MLQLEYNPPALSLSFASNLQSRPLGEILEISFVMMMITIFVTIMPWLQLRRLGSWKWWWWCWWEWWICLQLECCGTQSYTDWINTTFAARWTISLIIHHLLHLIIIIIILIPDICHFGRCFFVKNTGQKKFTRIYLWRSWQIWGMQVMSLYISPTSVSRAP